MASLEWYRSFVHICRRGTVSAAARSLGLTQPAVSQHLGGLEASLGAKLFQRTGKRMVLTQPGHTLYARVADAVEKLEALSGPNDGTAPLRLGTPPEFFEARLLTSLSRSTRDNLAITLGPAHALLDQLEVGALDVVVATVKRPSVGLSYRGLFEERFWLVAPPRTPPPSRRGLERFLREQRWVAYDADLPIIRRFLRQVLGRRLDLTPALTVPDLRAVRRAVELGMGVSVLPDYLCEAAVDRGQLTLAYAPEEAVTNDLWWVTARSTLHSPRLATLFEQVKEVSAR